MVKIKTYENTIKPVSPGNQGGATGFTGGQIQVASKSAIEELGKPLLNYYKNKAVIKEYNNKQEATLWVGEKFNELHQQHTEWEENFKDTDETVGGKGFTTKSLDKMQAIADAILLKAPNDDAANLFKQKINQYKLQVFNGATQHEATMQLFEQKSQLENIANGLALRAVENPENFANILEELNGVLNGLDVKGTEKIEGYINIWNQKTLGTESKTKRAFIAETMIQGIIDSGDEIRINKIKEMIENKDFDKIIEADKLIGYKNKINGLKDNIDAGKKFDFKVQMNDNIAAMENTGEITHNFSEKEIDYYFGKNSAEAAEYKYKLDIAKTVHNEIQSLSMMNGTDAGNYVSTLPENTQKAITVKEKLIGHFSYMSKLMNGDPVGFASTFRKDISEKLNSKDSSIKQDGMKELENMQLDWGVLPSNIKLLSNAERASLVEMISNFTVNDSQNVQALITQLKSDYGNYFDDVMAELVNDGKLSPLLSAAMMYSNDIDFPQLFMAARLTIDTKNIDATIINDSKNEVRELFLPIRSALTVANMNALPLVDGWQNLIEKRVLAVLAKDPTQDYKTVVENEFKRYVGDKFHVTEQFLVPKQETNFEAEELTAAADLYVEKLKDTDLELLMSGDITLDAIGLNQHWFETYQKENLKANVMWRNTGDGKGIELVFHFEGQGTYPVRQITDDYTTGLVTLTWENLDAIVQTSKIMEDKKDREVMKKLKKSKVYPIVR